MLQTGILKLEKLTKSASEFNCIIPEIQRSLDEEHVMNIYAYQRTVYDKLGQYLITGCISIAAANGIEYLIDGQHRITAYKQLLADYPDRKLEVVVDYYTCDTYESVEEVYKNVNTHKINPITQLEIPQYKITEAVEKYFHANFNSFIKSDNHRRPNISINRIKEYISANKIIERGQITSPDDFINRIKQLNAFYAKLAREYPTQFYIWGIKTANTNLADIHRHPTNLYLGLYNKYEWLDRIVDMIILPFDKQHHYTLDNPQTITKPVRTQVWNNMTMLVVGNCYCCNNTITRDNFECGHIIPRTLGGSATEENLRPICGQCNRNMRTMNLEEYKKLYQEQNGI